MEIIADIHPQFLDHFKSQLLFYEVMGSEVKVIYDGGGHQDRHQLMTLLVKRSFEDFPTSRTIRFWVFTGDNRPTNSVNNQPLFSISGPRIHSDYVIPDPYNLKWPQAGVQDFHEYCEKINLESKARPLKNSAIWRGLTCQNPIRKIVVDSCASLGEPFDLKDTTPDCNSSDFVQMLDLSKHAVLVDMPGQGFSGRLKYLLHAHRPIIVFERIDWDAVTLNLEPGFHYLSCSNDVNVFHYLVKKSIEYNDKYIKASVETVNLIKSLTSKKQVSRLLVKKVLTAIS